MAVIAIAAFFVVSSLSLSNRLDEGMSAVSLLSSHLSGVVVEREGIKEEEG